MKQKPGNDRPLPIVAPKRPKTTRRAHSMKSHSPPSPFATEDHGRLHMEDRYSRQANPQSLAECEIRFTGAHKHLVRVSLTHGRSGMTQAQLAAAVGRISPSCIIEGSQGAWTSWNSALLAGAMGRTPIFAGVLALLPTSSQFSRRYVWTRGGRYSNPKRLSQACRTWRELNN